MAKTSSFGARRAATTTRQHRGAPPARAHARLGQIPTIDLATLLSADPMTPTSNGSGDGTRRRHRAANRARGALKTARHAAALRRFRRANQFRGEAHEIRRRSPARSTASDRGGQQARLRRSVAAAGPDQQTEQIDVHLSVGSPSAERVDDASSNQVALHSAR
jgi:hypothetical protein